MRWRRDATNHRAPALAIETAMAPHALRLPAFRPAFSNKVSRKLRSKGLILPRVSPIQALGQKMAERVGFEDLDYLL